MFSCYCTLHISMHLNQTAKVLAFVASLCVGGYNIIGQNLAAIGKERPLKISGGASLSQIVYSASGIQSRRAPYTYYGSGNINFSFYGWNVPLSFAFSNLNTTFQQPFNQYSVHPTYKWVTGHFGYISMSYSPYTVSGHIFLGAAIDLAPEGKFKFSALYGRFMKAVQPDTLAANPPLAAFRQMGYGFKASYGSNGDNVDLIVFHAKDDVNSIRYVPEKDDILPQENLVMSIAAGKTLFKNFLLKAEFATSAMARDIRAPEGERVTNMLSPVAFLYTPRISSSYYHALKSSFAYQGNGYTVGVGYERVDPQYRTLGAYYFNNDLENITANAATAILKGKVNFAVNIGTQRDNLDQSKVSTMKRVVGSANIGYVPSQRLNFALSYSSFQTYTNIRSQFININQLTPYDNLDTLRYTQLSQNATLTTMYVLRQNKEKRQSINMNLTYQGAADKQGGIPQNSGLKFYNANIAYSMSLVPQNMTVSVSFNGTASRSVQSNTATFGPTIAVSRAFFDKKFRVTASSSANKSYADSMLLTTITNGRLTGSYIIQKKHNLNLSLVVVDRHNNVVGGAQSFTEFTGTLGYSYSFGR